VAAELRDVGGETGEPLCDDRHEPGGLEMGEQPRRRIRRAEAPVELGETAAVLAAEPAPEIEGEGPVLAPERSERRLELHQGEVLLPRREERRSPAHRERLRALMDRGEEAGGVLAFGRESLRRHQTEIAPKRALDLLERDARVSTREKGDRAPRLQREEGSRGIGVRPAGEPLLGDSGGRTVSEPGVSPTQGRRRR
jgi:hypothetical protein